MSYWEFPKYVSVAEKRAKAEKKLKQLRKKNPDIKPVVIDGRAIAKTWWGKSWNKNLELYADFSNRIGRGRSYVRHGAVLDLQIKPGKITSFVQGSTSKPYSVSVDIKTMDKQTWRDIKKKCIGKLDSLQKLIAGKFPRALSEMFTAKGSGLFPAPKEITFSCSCPDSAYMCKHVAATLYGIGARLDEDPGLFFSLRKINVNDLVSQAVKESAADLLKKAETKTARVMDASDMSDVFGIDLDEGIDLDVPDKRLAGKSPVKKKKFTKKRRPHTKAKAKKTKIPKPSKKRSEALSNKGTLSGKIVKKSSRDASAINIVEKIIKRRKKGIGIPELIDKTGFKDTKVRNIVFRLKKEGRIRNISKGVYCMEKVEKEGRPLENQ